MAKKENKLAGKGKHLWADFKAFITRGNVLDMAVGVVVGGAFGAIVTAVVNILLSVCTWAVPGGLNGLITVLPAINDAQRGMDASIGLGQTFAKGELQTIATNLAQQTYGSTDAMVIESTKSTILSKYTLFGDTYAYNMSAIINWGAVINAIISFIIIALVLFIIIKVAGSLKRAREIAEAKAKEEYYNKHPEERPAPVVEAAPAPTEAEILSEIRDLLKEKKSK